MADPETWLLQGRHDALQIVDVDDGGVDGDDLGHDVVDPVEHPQGFIFVEASVEAEKSQKNPTSDCGNMLLLTTGSIRQYLAL